MAPENTPFIDGPRPPLDPVRVERSLEYFAVRVDEDEYDIIKGSEGVVAYTVRLNPLNCDCGDAVYHNKICKHLIAALYADGDEEAVEMCNEILDSSPEWSKLRASYRGVL
jgi:hypothetical protein